MYPEKKAGYKIAGEHMAALANFDEMEFDQAFKAQRDRIFEQGI